MLIENSPENHKVMKVLILIYNKLVFYIIMSRTYNHI